MNKTINIIEQKKWRVNYAKKKELKSDRWNAYVSYVYGTMQEQGWKPKKRRKKK